jgi:hypothetical protein
MQSLQLLEIRQIQVLQVIDQNEIKLSMALHKMFLSLQRSQMDNNLIFKAGMFVNLGGNGGISRIGFNGMDICVGIGSHEESRETTITSKLQNGIQLRFFESVNQNSALLFSNIHHRVLFAKIIDGRKDCVWIIFMRIGKHILKKFSFNILRLILIMLFIFCVISQILTALSVWHIKIN